MRKALRLAPKGLGRVHPNPLVGAVVVKNGRVVGSGAHESFGGPHAEIQAIRAAKSLARGARLYVTLEPCPHTGKTPPCVDRILQCGIQEVIVAVKDPNPRVRGRGILALKKAGLCVRTGILHEQASFLNKDYDHWMRTRMPYVVVKFAQSLDGKMHDIDGRSRWISGKTSRGLAHRLRAEADGIVVGVETVLADDPLLTVRLKGRRGRQPLKVILDSRLRTPLNAKVFSKSSPGKVLIATRRGVSAAKLKKIQHQAEVLRLPPTLAGVALKALFKELGRRGIVNILIEGGPKLIEDALSLKVVSEIYCFVAPKVIGRLPLRHAQELRSVSVRRIDRDFLVRGRF